MYIPGYIVCNFFGPNLSECTQIYNKHFSWHDYSMFVYSSDYAYLYTSDCQR